MKKNMRIFQMVLLTAVLIGTLSPVFIKPAKAVTYQWDYGAIQIRAWYYALGFIPIWEFTFQAWTQVRSYNPGSDYWRILRANYNPTYLYPWLSPFKFQLLDITYHDEYMSWGWILTGVTYRAKIYNSNNPARYTIFDITAKVYAGGGAIVDFEWIEYHLAGTWQFYIEELDYNGMIKDAMAEYWGPGDIPV